MADDLNLTCRRFWLTFPSGYAASFRETPTQEEKYGRDAKRYTPVVDGIRVRDARKEANDYRGLRADGKMLHKGQTVEFVFYSDEPEHMGGESDHPKPLSYIAAGTGF